MTSHSVPPLPPLAHGPSLGRDQLVALVRTGLVATFFLTPVAICLLAQAGGLVR